MPIIANEAPKFDQFLDCVNCGFCLPVCPTFMLLGTEMDSPRGRIHLMRSLAEKNLEETETYREHIETCLVCRSCETACPSGVQFGDMMEAARSQLQSDKPRRGRALALAVLAHPKFLRAASTLLRAAQRMGLTDMYEKIFSPKHFSTALLPEIPRAAIRKTYDAEIVPARGEKKYRVGFLRGCIADVWFSNANRASVEVLSRNGCEVVMPAGQNCCGSLFAHNGEREQARTLARNNIDVFLGAGVEAIITNAAGCGATMKEYESLLEHDAVYHEKARIAASLTRDICEFLAAIPLQPCTNSIPATVAYHDACHLAHGQQIREAPRAILGMIPNLNLVELNDGETCCGSAGIYNVMQPELAAQLQQRKIDFINRTGATIVAAGNPGCVLQIAAGAKKNGLPLRVAHPVELLAEAYAERRTAEVARRKFF